VFAAVYVGMSMLICTLSLALNIFIISIYHRSPDHEISKWVFLHVYIRECFIRLPRMCVIVLYLAVAHRMELQLIFNYFVKH